MSDNELHLRGRADRALEVSLFSAATLEQLIIRFV